MKLSVIIPMYNEKKIITDTITQLKLLADAHKERSFEFILVDDGSRDGCGAITAKIILRSIKDLSLLRKNIRISIYMHCYQSM
jgi:glycosyltransferase involved in cell wall biosynthesis